MNGIEDIVSRADLANCGIFLMLQPIREQHRRSEVELWRAMRLVGQANDERRPREIWVTNGTYRANQ